MRLCQYYRYVCCWLLLWVFGLDGSWAVTNQIDFRLKSSTIEQLEVYTQILNKEISEVLEEALEAYFVSVEKRLLEKNIADENTMTNLDYDEFWDGVEV